MMPILEATREKFQVVSDHGEHVAWCRTRSDAEQSNEKFGNLMAPDVTPKTHPNHHTVGKEYMGYNVFTEKETRWFCASHDACGYWMYATDGCGEWHNVSERAINRTFHEILVDECGLYTGYTPNIPNYVGGYVNDERKYKQYVEKCHSDPSVFVTEFSFQEWKENGRPKGL